MCNELHHTIGVTPSVTLCVPLRCTTGVRMPHEWGVLCERSNRGGGAGCHERRMARLGSTGASMDHPGPPLQASDNTPQKRAVGSPAPNAELPHSSGGVGFSDLTDLCASPESRPRSVRAVIYLSIYLSIGWPGCKRTSTGHSVFTVKLPCGCR